MKLLYRYTVDDAVLTVFAEAKKRHREELLRIFACLINEPFVEADYVQKDACGRNCQVKRFGPWLVTYWPEHLSNQIHVINISRLL